MRLEQCQIFSVAHSVNALTLIGFWGDVNHERQKVLQELGVVIRKLQTLAVFPADTAA